MVVVPRVSLSRRAFTLLELLVVMSIILVLTGMLTGAIFVLRMGSKRKAAKLDIETFSVSLAAYHRDHGAYPPDNWINELNGPPPGEPANVMNECLIYYLTTKLKKGLNTYGPYARLKKNKLSDDDDDGYFEYKDPFENFFLYAENESHSDPVGRNPRSYDLVSPGEDGKLGGKISASTGYQPPTNDVGKLEERDNISNWRK